MSYSLFMNNVNETNTRPRTRESTLKRSMRRTRTAPLITPFTCREREGEVGKLCFAGRTFLTFLPCRIAARWRWRDARTTRPDAMARLQQLFIRCHAVAMLYGR